MPAPVMTPELREKAAAARRAASEARGALRSGRITIADVLDGNVPALNKARVRRVLTDLPGIGNARAAGLITGAGVPAARCASVRVQGLGPRQRAALRQALTA